MARLHTIIIGALLLAGCATPVVDVTVSAPRVYGDDHVLRALADRHAQVRPAARGAIGAPIQESLGVRHDEATRIAATVDLVGPSDGDPEAPAAPAHPEGCRCHRCAALLLIAGASGPISGPTSSELLQQRLDLVDDVLARERRSEGDAALLGPRARAVLLRFDVCFNAYLDLGARRQFVVVAFRVRGKDTRTPPFDVHLLAPELRSIASDEWLVDVASSDLAASLLGSWGGTGLTAGWSSRDRLEERFEALLSTPLQFGIYRGRGNVEEPAFSFAFAFGPRRRLLERALLNPARWFGSSYEIAYELQPGPRPCEAVLVFPEVPPGAPLDLVVEVFCDGALVSEEEVDVSRALGRPLSTFEVACPPLPVVGPTAAVDLDPRAGADLVLDAGPDGPTFTVASQVLPPRPRPPRRPARGDPAARRGERARPSADARSARLRLHREPRRAGAPAVTRAPLLLMLLLAGCSRDVLRLEPEWAPLVEVVERPSLVLTDETTTTLGTRLYVADLDAWERRHPEGSVERAALLLHEQEHARRQLATGIGRWLGRYLNDREFMWAEEQRGYALQLRHLARHGRPVNPQALAATLHDYRNLEGRMVGYAEALAFVQAVLWGTWVPPPEAPRG